MQINRLFETVYLLLERKGATARELAEHFEVSVRTIYRDIEVLSAAGIPVYMSKGKGGGISLLPEFVLNKTVLTEGEKADILSSLSAVNSVNPHGEDTAIQKLSSLFGQLNADWIEVDFSPWADAGRERELFEQLKAAVLHKYKVCFSYASGRGQSTDREAEPLKLYFKGSSWYLYGYCNIREDFRFFKLSRIKKLQVLEERFERISPKQIMTEDNQFEKSFITLKLKIAKQMAFRVYDEFETFEQLPDGSFLAEILYPEGSWVFYYIASFGEYCEVLEPKEVREDIKEKLRKAYENYL